MKPLFIAAVAAGLMLAGVSCERHAWDETRKLHEKHGSGHGGDAESAGHGEGEAPEAGGHEEGGAAEH